MQGYKSIKIRNIIEKNFSGLTVSLKNNKATPHQCYFNEKAGCRGFISNGVKTCYLSTEQSCASWLRGALIRECRDTRDYTGGHNEFVETEAEFIDWIRRYFAA